MTIVDDTTNHKRAEETLGDSQESYRSLIETARDVIYRLSADGTILSLNRAFEAITGWRRAEWLGKPFDDIVHPDDLPLARSRFRRVLRGEVPPRIELRILSKSGQYLTGEFAARPLTDDGRVTGTVGVARDITERKRAEEALRESEERYRQLVELSPDAVAVYQEGRIVFANTAAATLLGAASPQDLADKPVMDIVHPDYRGIAEERMRMLQEEGTQLPRVEQKFVRADGTSVDVEITSSSISLNGRPAVQVIARDITERRRMEEALRESERKYRNLVEGINEVVYELDASGRVTYISPAVTEAGSYHASELMGRTVTDFVHPEDVPRAIESFRRALSGVVEPSEYRVVSGSGTVLWVRVFGRPIYEGDRVVGMRGVLMDITERRRTEEALRESEKKYRNLVEGINEAVFELDATGRATYIGPALEQSGFSPSEVIGRQFSEFIHPDDLPAIRENFRRRLAGDSEPIEYRVLSKSGEVIWVRSFGRLVYDGDRVVGVRGVLSDITERKRMEEALQRAREELEGKVERQMMRSNPCGLTFRELTVLHLVAAGKADKEIGAELGISPLTASKHVSNILAKMGAASRTEAAARALREGLLD